MVYVGYIMVSLSISISIHRCIMTKNMYRNYTYSHRRLKFEPERVLTYFSA